jgi:hypothetical protein
MDKTHINRHSKGKKYMGPKKFEGDDKPLIIRDI